ncbi:hypothetical protein FZ103_20510 [Streptomonospora sp. PA3]|uniref:hypothetical protein n=1 Tax=Streptomonospora sp. PA3 TaxID=2607326 RepID=UPI0012DD8F95|nr:hypothetical protein [Streptomonospora sp. PA3]MUL43523.1 hypothetical protein [Streptomonospora sp. PA3]
MRSLRDMLIFVFCGIALIVWGVITLLSPGAAAVASAGSPYWTIPLGIAMLAAGFALDAVSRRRRRRAAAAQPGSEADAAPAREEEPRDSGGAAPPAA